MTSSTTEAAGTDLLTRDAVVGDLKSRWLTLRDSKPELRFRDAADELGVSEGELLACRVGDGVRRLEGPWEPLIEALPKLGKVMALTRNEQAVHEKVGCFEKISVSSRFGLVLGTDIDLRILLGHWHFGFAVAEPIKNGVRRSLQFFDCDGTAVHKIYLRNESDETAYQALVAAHLDPSQDATPLPVAPRPAEPAERPDSEIDVATLRQRWEALKDVHQFHGMLGDLDCRRTQAFRLVGSDLAAPAPVESFVRALEKAAEASLPIMIFVGSPGTIQIHSGPVRKLMPMGPWFNVMDPGFNLHLRADLIDTAWIVRKPTKDGTVTSLEIFDSAGGQIATMFGVRKEGQAESPQWRDLLADPAIQGSAVS